MATLENYFRQCSILVNCRDLAYMFRIAAILHGVHSRALAGNAASNDAAETGGRAVAVADVAWRTVQALG